MGETFLLTLKMVINYTSAMVLADSHPIQHVWHMEWNLNEVILEVHNIFHNIFVQIVSNY